MIKLHSNILGEGKSFLILHGFLGMGDNWKTLGTKFSKKGYQVHLIDQRNHGKSPHSSEMDYDIMASDINDYCEQHHLKDIILLGHSMGGKVAMFTAANFPDIIEKLIIVDISPKYYSPHHQDILTGLTALDNASLQSRGEAEDFLKEFVPDEGTRLFLLKNLYWKTKDKLSLRLNLEVLTESSETVGEALDPSVRFDKPTLFIKGGDSNYILEEDSALISLHFQNSEIVSIADAGHWVHAQKMTEFYEVVMRFL